MHTHTLTCIEQYCKTGKQEGEKYGLSIHGTGSVEYPYFKNTCILTTTSHSAQNSTPELQI